MIFGTILQVLNLCIACQNSCVSGVEGGGKAAGAQHGAKRTPERHDPRLVEPPKLGGFDRLGARPKKSQSIIQAYLTCLDNHVHILPLFCFSVTHGFAI